MLLDKLDDPVERDRYAAAALQHGWSRKMLLNQIIGRLPRRVGAAPSNFAQHLAEPDSELTQELTKDPYVFDFLHLTERASEKDVEAALMGRLQETLLDLLLFHVEQLRYVVIELKIGKFKPDHLGQLGFYVAVVDDRLRRPGLHSPTVGILLCAGRNDAVVHYALANTTAPMAVAGYTSSPVDPDQLNLPRRAELEAIIAIPVTGRADATLPDEDA